MTDEPADESLYAAVEAELKALQAKMKRAAKAGDMELYAALKDEHVQVLHDERQRVLRARRAQLQAQVQESAPPERWKLPFRKSPGAIERDRRPPPPEKPQVPAGGHLSPWRRSGSAMSERLWRP